MVPGGQDPVTLILGVHAQAINDIKSHCALFELSESLGRETH